MKKANKKVTRFRIPFQITFGFIIFTALFVFLSYHVFSYFFEKRVSVYNVEHSIVNNNISFTGIAARNEKIISADGSGYASYYIRDGEKAPRNSIIYTLSPVATDVDSVIENNSIKNLLTKENYDDLTKKISGFQSYYDPTEFNEIYAFKYELDNSILEMANEYMVENATNGSNDKNSKTENVSKCITKESGIITYNRDGMEDISLDNLSVKAFNRSNYSKKSLKTNKEIKSGDPVYKIIEDENWHILGHLSKEDASKLEITDSSYTSSDENKKSTTEDDSNADSDSSASETASEELPVLTIQIAGCDYTVDCNYRLVKKDNNYFIDIIFNKMMSNFIYNRFLDCEIIIGQPDGLKIPNTALTKTTMYQVPKSCLSPKSDALSNNILSIANIDESTGKTTFSSYEVTIFAEDEKNVYTDLSQFPDNTVFQYIKGNKDYSATIGSLKKKEFDSVYSCNDGIAELVYVNIIAQTDDYSVCQNKEKHSLALYDQIVLDSNMVKQGELIIP